MQNWPVPATCWSLCKRSIRWASRSVDEAIETLASPDVTVTNQSDKELQLYKLRELDSLVQEAVAQCAREAADPTVVEIAPPSRG